MYKIKLFCCLMFSSVLLFAQTKSNKDVIYLKDGSIIKGSIIDSTDLRIKIKTGCENIWSFDQITIDSISLEDVVSENIMLKINSHFVITDLGILSGSSHNEREHPFSLHMVNAYSFTKNISAGMGVGIEFYNEPIVPIFMDGRFLFNKQNRLSAPFVYAKIGYSFSLEDKEDESGNNFDSKGGPMSGIGFGYIFSINERNGILICVGYRFQQLEHIRTNDWNNEQVHRYEKYNRLAIKIGLLID